MSNIIIIVITLIFSAFFSGLEIAFITVNRLKIEVDKNQGKYYARILSELTKTPSRFIGSLLVANNIAIVIYGIVMEELLGPLLISALPPVFLNAAWILILQTLISTFIILIIGEFIPKTLFRINPNSVLKIFALPAYLFYVVLYPVVYLFTTWSERLLRNYFKVQLVTDNYVFTMVDLDNYLKEFSSSNPAPAAEINTEIQMFQNAMEFRSVKVRECMVPRTDLKALEDTEEISRLMQLAIETGHSKILIYKDSIDNIIGYTHTFDLFHNPSTIQEILKPVLIVPESMFANQALQLLLQQRKSVAVVVDEFGGTSGIVTMEDIIEEIFGEIHDEYDVNDKVEKQVGKNEYLFSGRLEIDYLNEKYNLMLPVSEEYETLAGFIINFHESIPELNDEIIIDPYVFTITQARENLIEQVRLRIIV
ncbi:MAG: hemolysin family protein [Bacteroidetes bacterium]|nr:hemolysin family protein [Bacteroidota bacterium]